MMLWIFEALAAWFCGSVLFLALRHRSALKSLWCEPVLTRPVMIVESDDWGIGPESDAYALNALAALLHGIRDETCNPAVMTLGVVLGGPDGARIRATGFSAHHRRTLLDPQFAPIVGAIRTGCAKGVFAMQRHGMEHYWPSAVMARARHDEELQRWLTDPCGRSEALPSELQSRWIDASELPSHPLSRAEIDAAVSEEAAMLRQIFGTALTVAVPNTFVWNDDVECAWAASGVVCIVTPGRRFESRDANGRLLPPTRILRNGDRVAHGKAVVVVRDDYFEPIRGHRAEQVWAAVARKAALCRPTLLETHRENFIASPSIASGALQELERALRGVLERHPHALFMSTAGLAAHFADPCSSLCERSLSRRLKILLLRMQHDSELARFMKFSGLGIALLLGSCIARSVTPARFQDDTR